VWGTATPWPDPRAFMDVATYRDPSGKMVAYLIGGGGAGGSELATNELFDPTAAE